MQGIRRMSLQKTMKGKLNDKIKQKVFTVQNSKKKKINENLEKKTGYRGIKQLKESHPRVTDKIVKNKLNNSTDKEGQNITEKEKDRVTTNCDFPYLSVNYNFDWNVKQETAFENIVASEESEEENEDFANKKKMSRLEKLASAKEKESRLRQIESELLQGEQNPQSADQFDRALLAHPENAVLWIKYMSFYLQATEIDKARAIARRALQTISHHNEGERFNVWVALLNLEHTYGTEESLKEAFEEALRTNDENMVYTKMLEIYASGNKTYNAEMTAKTIIKKFRCSYDCWLQVCKVLMKHKMIDKARMFFLQAAQNLTRKEHVNLTSQFAKLENESGFTEEANTLYENILTSFPDRTDIWNVYVDMLVKENRINQAREVMERAVRQKLAVKKMKSLYTKWLSFEEKFGSEDTVERVKQAAQQYINKVTNSLPK